mgnify:CR=1 FL=1
MTFVILQVLVINLILPAVFIYSLWRGSFESKLEWLIQLLATTLLTVWVFLAGRWDWTGYYMRYAWLVFLAAAIYLSWRKTRSRPFRIAFDRKQKWSMGVCVVVLLVFGLYNVFVISSLTTQDDAIALSFPLKSGTYYVGQGGNHVQMNYHQAYSPQEYALDIVKINTLGLRAHGLYPKDLHQYEIYGDRLFSPCDGEVLETRGDLPDLTPPDTDPDQPEGNYVALTCDDEEAVIYICHMQQGSVAVAEGDVVREGQLLGTVGNSGNTSEPHLHIHAEKDGEGVPIRFGGRFLVRNNLMRK